MTEPPTVCQHTFGDWLTVKQSNCTEDGKCIRTCSKCSETEEEPLPKNDVHTPVTVPAVPATCKAAGLTEGSRCALCGKVFVAQTPTEKLVHNHHGKNVKLKLSPKQSIHVYTVETRKTAQRDSAFLPTFNQN